ncbi:MAG: hypothetical protein ACP5NI_04660 [Acetobacteraceae bacterium]
MIAFIDDRGGAYGLGPRSDPGPISKVLPIARSACATSWQRLFDLGDQPCRLREGADMAIPGELRALALPPSACWSKQPWVASAREIPAPGGQRARLAAR